MENQARQRIGLSVMVSLFFCWGFVAAANNILIPVCKELFHLSQTQAQFVDLAFYLAYALGGLSYFLLSLKRGDPLEHFGYRKGLMTGLLLAAFGAGLFYPAALWHAYGVLLAGLFSMGLGFSLLQIAANPYVMAMGASQFEAQRINLAGALNSLGTTIGPLAINAAVFGAVVVEHPAISFGGLGNAYVLVALFLVLLALFFRFYNLPKVKRPQESPSVGWGALRFAQLRLGMLGIFVYVGTEVSIPANLSAYLEQEMEWSIQQASPLISLYWGSLMMGRWMGSAAVLGLPRRGFLLLRLLAPFMAFGLVLGLQFLLGVAPSQRNLLWTFVAYIPVVLVVPYLLGKEKPGLTLQWLSGSGLACMLVAVFLPGPLGALAAVAGGLACAVLWPCIFSLALRGLGTYTNQGAGLLVVMIVGGAVIPMLQGAVGDVSGSMAWSYVVPALGFLSLLVLGWRLRRIPEADKVESI